MVDKRTGPRCGAKAKRGTGPCKQFAGWRTRHPGTGACILHGGNMINHLIHAERSRRTEALQRAAKQFGVPIDMDPEEALLGQVAESAGLVEFYRTRLRELLEAEEHSPDSLGDDRSRWANLVGPVTTGAGLLGPKIELDREGAHHIVGEDVRAFVKLYNGERDRLVKTAKAAADAGIAKKAVDLAARQGETMVVVITNVFARLQLPQDVIDQARQLIAQEFRAVATAERMVIPGTAVEVRGGRDE